MAVGPAHGRLDGQVQPIEPDVERHLDAAQYRGLDAVEGDLQSGDGGGTHAGYFTTLRLGSPVPGQKLVEPVDCVIGDPRQHIRQPGLRIDVVELRRRDQRGHEGGAIGAALRAGKQPGLASQGKSALPRRALAAISANSKNCLRACAQHSAAVIAP